MTEDEARQKWCPFARVAMISSSDIECPPCNRLAIDGVSGLEKNPAGARCIASDCMAWRQTATLWLREGVANPVRAVGDTPAPYQSKQVGSEGYCGLAGK